MELVHNSKAQNLSESGGKEIMKTQFKIIKNNGQISISAPFSAENNTIFRSKGGKFDTLSKCWIFDNTGATEAMIAELWGEESTLVRAEIPLEKIDGYDQWRIGGYALATRRNRDYAVEIADGVQLLSGAFTKWGGSVKSPRVGREDQLLSLICRKSFAQARDLKIIEESMDVINPLEKFSDSEIVAEMHRRGLA